MNLIKAIFGDLNAKEVKKLMKRVVEIENKEAEIEKLTDIELREKTNEFKERLAKGETLDDILTDAFAVVREAAWRVLGLKHYPVQLLGGIVLHEGRIAEMKTGEGKTLMATAPVYLNALSGEGTHVITVNDYLALRDKEWMGKLYDFLGLTVGCVVHGISKQERRDAYQADITYGTNNEFGFDYLRDNMSVRKEDLSQRPLNFAIVDEVDSILIDEARTPLIISGNGKKGTDLYKVANMFAKTLDRNKDLIIDEKAKSIHLSDEIQEGSEDENIDEIRAIARQNGEITGVEKAERYFSIENLSDPENMQISHHVNQAIRATNLMKKDVDYVVKDGEVVIVDEFTGRLMQGRRYSNGLHQAIEAKEGIEIRKESMTLATITIQNYFRMYKKLSGMTGTAKTEEEEFRDIYSMDCVVVPTNRPIARIDMDDAIFKSLEGKFDSVIEDVKEKHERNQPVLVGTVSIEISEYLSKRLKREGVRHEVLNAKKHDRESEIVAQAGRYGAVTIATNMAGRGTDIVLGGNPEFMAKREMSKKGYEMSLINKVISPFVIDEEEVKEAKKVYDEIFAKHKEVTDAENKKVIEAGGLHIIGTERHESRRIDNQLRGRAGRQGDPGSTRFFISFEDDLMRLFVSDKAKSMVEKMGLDDGTLLENPLLSKAMEGAQKKVESRNYGIRKHVLQYDDVINKQRDIIYSERNSVLHGDNIKSNIETMINKIIDGAISIYTDGYKYPEDWDLDGLKGYMEAEFMPKDVIEFENIEDLTIENLRDNLYKTARDEYTKKETELGEKFFREIERAILLRNVDSKWIDHIDSMDQFKQGVGLRSIGQQDPVMAYKIEGFQMFDEMIQSIQSETVRVLYNVTLKTDSSRSEAAVITGESGPQEGPAKINAMTSPNGASPQRQAVSVKPYTAVKKPGRNDPCHCGSGKKYKKCCEMKDSLNE